MATTPIPHRRLLLVVLGMLGAVGPLSIDTYLPALPRVASAVHASSSLVGSSITASVLGLAVGQLVAGPASDRHGRRMVVLAGTAGFAIFSALCAIAPTIECLILFRLLQGLTGSAGIVVSRAVVRDLYTGDDLSRIFSRLILVTGTAPVIAPLLGAQILNFSNWRGIFWALAGIGALLLLATARLVPETLPPERRMNHTVRDDVGVYRRIMRDRGFLPYLLATGGFSAVLFSFLSGSPFVVEKIYGDSPTVFSLVFAGVSFVMIVGGQINARLVRHHSASRMLRRAMTVSAAGAILMLFTTVFFMGVGLWLFVVALLLSVSPNGAILPNATGLAMRNYRANAGAASALMGAATFFVGGLVSPLVGVAGERSAVPMGIVMAVGAVGGLLLLVLFEGKPVAPEVGDESRAAVVPNIAAARGGAS